jgi:hypothetical protein
MVKSYSDSQLLDRVKSIKSFKGIPEGYWILGVRSDEDTPNKFDDKFYIWNGEKFITMTSGTTNPGTPILEGGFLKYNKVGAAVVKSDEWYYGVWKYGMHHSKMPALIQIGKFLGYRDGDKDKKAEEIGPINTFEWTGINFHTVSYDLSSKKISETIGEWSAGCQVVNNVEKYSMIINMLKKQHNITYCLINEF